MTRSSQSSDNGDPAGTASGRSGSIERPDGYVDGRPSDGPPPPRRELPEGARPGTPLRPGEWQPSEERPKPEKPDPQAKRPKRKDAERLADKRGADWGLRDAAQGSIPVTRPIHIECYLDRLVIVPERGMRDGKVLFLENTMEASIDKFISAVWEHMDGWGIAGKGMYWRPVLTVTVSPAAEERFAELKRLLEGSGLAVERKK